MDVWTTSSKVITYNVKFIEHNQMSALLGDTVLHSWEVLAKILASEEAFGIVCDIGM